MAERYELVKEYLMEMEIVIVSESPEEELCVVDDEDRGIKNLVLDCEDSILIMEQVIMPVPDRTDGLYQDLLKWNRDLIHGAFVLDEAGQRVIWRDTLQLENLDRNEIEGSIQALALALAEYSGALLDYARK